MRGVCWRLDEECVGRCVARFSGGLMQGVLVFRYVCGLVRGMMVDLCVDGLVWPGVLLGLIVAL